MEGIYLRLGMIGKKSKIRERSESMEVHRSAQNISRLSAKMYAMLCPSDLISEVLFWGYSLFRLIKIFYESSGKRLKYFDNFVILKFKAERDYEQGKRKIN